MTPRRLIDSAGAASGRTTLRRRMHAAFTLVEMLVAVAAIGIIALGLSRLFASTSKTVSVGRRVSVMNEYAGLIERTMRADIQAMSRNGFLVMRHRDVGGTADNNGVLLYRDERDGFSRRRRVDELMFFVERPTASVRQAVSDAKFPIGSAARVYYGHGLKRELFSAGVADAAAMVPQLNDDNSGAFSFGQPGSSNAVGPNEFASEWILMRHITALVPPRLSTNAPPSTITGPLANAWPDTLVQVGLQPATPSIFRNEVARATSQNIENGAPWARENDPRVVPNVASGLVDVAAMDLEGVRSRILQGNTPFGNTNEFLPQATGLVVSPSRFLVDQNVGDENSVPTYMKKWMAMALPGGPPVGSGPYSFDPATQPGNGGDAEIRMRAESQPPDFTGSRNLARFAGNEAYRRADQLMLSASNFVPGCSEFIVEWSFGARFADNDPNRREGEIIWHGLPRYRFPDGDTTNFQNANRVADVYRGRDTSTATEAQDQVAQPYIGYNAGNNSVQPLLYPVQSDLIHYPIGAWNTVNRPWPEGQALYSFFGLVNPTYPPSVTINGNTGIDPFASPATLPWAWPKLIRVTISLVDPADPSGEQTYQFIFDVPQNSPSSF